jgi:exodeoxyribonuclease V alpha subunit
MNEETITHLIETGYLSEIDVHFGKFITALDKNDNPAIFIAAALVSRATGDGDGFLDLNSIFRKSILSDIIGTENLQSSQRSEWLKALNQSRVVGAPGEVCPLILDDKNRLYLYRYWDYEQRLSSLIKSRIQEDVQGIDKFILKNSLNRLFPDNGTNEFNWYKVAGVIAAFKKFCVITGGPGTGKTFTTAKILALLLELSKKKLNIFLAAPTGKAAARIGESIKAAKKTLNCSLDIIDAIPSETYTIHRMLKTIPGSPYFYHNAKNPLSADIVVVDEVSMVDLALMSKLISAVKDDARIILIGDRDQLASVEAGFVMSDICDRDNVHLFSDCFCRLFEELTHCKMEISSNRLKDAPGLYDCMVVLKKSYRFTDKSGIGELSKAVNNGKIDDAAFSILQNNAGQIVWEKISNSNGLSIALPKEVINGYSDYLNCQDPLRALELFNRFRILCAVKFGVLGVIEVNRLAEEILNNNDLIELDNISTYPWYRGRPVLITRNNYGLELFNGDIGITMPEPESGSKDLYVYFSDISGKLRRFLPHRLPEHETAYAMTVHKSQGSEFENVLLVLPNQDYPVLTRELIYTGITRAKNHISIWGREEIIKATILRKISRNSGLKDALWEETI